MKKPKIYRGKYSSPPQDAEYGSHASSERRENASDYHFAKIFISVLILLIASMAVIFFSIVNGRNVPAFSDQGSASSQVTRPTIDPTVDPPYATEPTKDSYLPIGNGTGLGGAGLYSEYAILVDVSDMSALARKDPDTPIYPASMTKIMTVVVACDLIPDLNDTYVIKKSVLNQMPYGASSAWLKDFVGKTVTVKDLLYGVTYKSGADAVLSLIDYLGLSTEQFVSLMNQKAQELGLSSTHFGGPIGMDDENNRTTCREMAAIMAYAMENPLCRELFGGDEYRLSNIDMTYYHLTLVTTISERMGKSPSTLVNGYTVIAAKSGYEDKAGHCLCSYIRNNATGECFVLVTAHSDGDKTNPIGDIIRVLNNIKP